MWRASRPSVHTRRLCVCVPREGASLWRVWVSMRGGLVVACLGCPHEGGLVRAGCETQWLQSVHKLSSEHVHTLPRSVLRHQLGHATSVATFEARVAPNRGNVAGLSPPGATAHQEVVFQVQVGRCWPRQELKEKLSASVCVVAKVCLIRRGQGQSQCWLENSTSSARCARAEGSPA